ncbi:hypothetical protein [Romboutsia sp. MSSM.1001216sp_RTP31141st1_G3_RTP31141_220114]|uniref:hypothetical protein n=1 Tax=unclassified Romboutsia TaxID=2626894 RepID=UPI0031B60AA4
MIAFIIWLLIGVAFVGLGIYCIYFTKDDAFGFWANTKMFPVEDVKSYNKALGKLWCVFGVLFAILGLPLLAGQNSPYALIPAIGVFFEVIITMVIYTIKIEPKYRKK